MNLEELEASISRDPSPVMAARELLKKRYNADAEAFRQGADVRALVHSRADTSLPLAVTAAANFIRTRILTC